MSTTALPPATISYNPQMEQRRASTVALSYLLKGSSGRPLVLCLHGFPDVPRTWEPMSDRLVRAGYRVVAPWMRGYAPSTLEGPFDLESLATDVVALADELSADEPVYLLGHDWGAAVAYAALATAPARFRAAATFAVPHPIAVEKNLVRQPAQFKLSSYMGVFQVPKLSERLVARNDFAYVERLWRAWSPGFEPSVAHLAEVKGCLRASLPAPLAYYRALRSFTTLRSLHRLFLREPISVPTLYVHGQDDGCIRPELSNGQQAFFTGPYERILVPNAGHFAHLEQAESVGEATLGWFRAASDADERELALV